MIGWLRRRVRIWLTRRLAGMPDRRGVRFLLQLHDRLFYFMLGVIKLTEDGAHPRHRLTDTHAFFLAHVRPDDRVLDVGAAYGHVAEALAAKVASVTGVETRPEAVRRARERVRRDNVRFLVGDFLEFIPDDRYDVIVAANVLEHIGDRQTFLRKCGSIADRLLVRVPAINRDWLVPYRRELGLEWRLHPDHEIEYTEHTLRAELQAAGFRVTSCAASYGALHAAAEAGPTSTS